MKQKETNKKSDTEKKAPEPKATEPTKKPEIQTDAVVYTEDGGYFPEFKRNGKIYWLGVGFFLQVVAKCLCTGFVSGIIIFGGLLVLFKGGGFFSIFYSILMIYWQIMLLNLSIVNIRVQILHVKEMFISGIKILIIFCEIMVFMSIGGLAFEHVLTTNPRTVESMRGFMFLLHILLITCFYIIFEPLWKWTGEHENSRNDKVLRIAMLFVIRPCLLIAMFVSLFVGIWIAFSFALLFFFIMLFVALITLIKSCKGKNCFKKKNSKENEGNEGNENENENEKKRKEKENRDEDGNGAFGGVLGLFNFIVKSIMSLLHLFTWLCNSPNGQLISFVIFFTFFIVCLIISISALVSIGNNVGNRDEFFFTVVGDKSRGFSEEIAWIFTFFKCVQYLVFFFIQLIIALHQEEVQKLINVLIKTISSIIISFRLRLLQIILNCYGKKLYKQAEEEAANREKTRRVNDKIIKSEAGGVMILVGSGSNNNNNDNNNNNNHKKNNSSSADHISAALIIDENIIQIVELIEYRNDLLVYSENLKGKIHLEVHRLAYMIY